MLAPGRFPIALNLHIIDRMLVKSQTMVWNHGQIASFE